MFFTGCNHDPVEPEVKTYTVTFDLNGGDGTAPAEQVVAHGKLAEEPKTPKRAGYNFAGWYTDKALTSKASFPLTVTKDTTLYAK